MRVERHVEDWPYVSGPIAGLVRATDWSATALGPLENWSSRLKAAVETLLPNGFPMIALWGPDLVQIYNDGYAELMGPKHPGGFGRSNRECWPEVWHINEPIYARVLAGETITFKDALYPLERAGKAESVWLNISYSPLRDDDGSIAGVLVAMFETTGRVMAERSRDAHAADLADTGQRFRAFVTASADVVYRMSPDWSEMRELDGRGLLADTPTETAQWLDRYIDKEDQPRVLEAIEKAIRERSVYALEHRVRSAEGEIRWVSSRAAPIFDEAGSLREWIGTASDVTDRKSYEEALKESEARHRTLVQASNQVLYRHNPDWTEMSQLTGGGFLADTAAPDPDWFDAYIPAEDQPHVRSVIQQAIDARSVFELEHRVRRADGSLGWTMSRSIPLLGADDEILGWFGAASDVTDRREAEERLRDSEERLRASATRLEVLFAELQHRTRNMLTVVQGLFHQTALSCRDPQQLRERFDARLAALSRVNGLLSHIEGAERVAFDQLIADEVAAVAGENRQQQIRLDGPRGIKLRSSSVQTFALALHELATNAVKHGALSQTDGRLEVTWSATREPREGRLLHVEWRETGIAAPEPASGGPVLGAGRKLIERALPHQLGATVDYRLGAENLVCRISLPVSQDG